jgi:hypothetical protein
MAQNIPSRWSYIVKYIGGHSNIIEECNAILRFTRKKVEIESLGKGKIVLDYNDCTLEMQLNFQRPRIVLIYQTSYETEGRIFMQFKKEIDDSIDDVFTIYKKAALGLESDIPLNSKKYFKFFKTNVKNISKP